MRDGFVDLMIEAKTIYKRLCENSELYKGIICTYLESYLLIYYKEIHCMVQSIYFNFRKYGIYDQPLQQMCCKQNNKWQTGYPSY